jgi:hypothetical protein
LSYENSDFYFVGGWPMEIIRFENIDSSKLAADIVLNPIKQATDGILTWHGLSSHLRLTIAKHESKASTSADLFSVKLSLRLPDGRCFDCENKAETLSFAADSVSLALRNFLQN